MKRKMLKVLAIAMAATLALPTWVSAVPAPTAPGGAATIVNPVFNVTLPANLNFTIDPFQVRDSGQIFSPEYAIINRSNVPVVVAADFVVQRLQGTTNTESPVNLVASVGPSLQTPAITAKNAEFSIEFADGIVTSITPAATDFRLNTTLATGATGTNLAFTWADDEIPRLTFLNGTGAGPLANGTVIGNATAMAPAAWANNDNAATVAAARNVFFVLDSAVEYFNTLGTALRPNEVIGSAQTSTTDPEDLVAAFRITGNVSTYAPWAVADIRLFSRFTISPRTGTDFDNITANPANVKANEPLNVFTGTALTP